jgi:uncharacterized OB-fold protein
MPLSVRLREVDLTLECKRCGHLIVKQGVWCEECKSEVRLTYNDKAALFTKHAHLA